MQSLLERIQNIRESILYHRKELDDMLEELDTLIVSMETESADIAQTRNERVLIDLEEEDDDSVLITGAPILRRSETLGYDSSDNEEQEGITPTRNNM